MIIEITQRTWSNIKNPYFSAYARMYLDIYENFLRQVEESGVEIDSRSCVAQTKEKIRKLKRWGPKGKRRQKHLWRRISPACEACRKGVGSAIFYFFKCPRNCYYCFNPNQEYYEYFLTNERDCIRNWGRFGRREGSCPISAFPAESPWCTNQVINFFQQSRQCFPRPIPGFIPTGTWWISPSSENCRRPVWMKFVSAFAWMISGKRSWRL